LSWLCAIRGGVNLKVEVARMEEDGGAVTVLMVRRRRGEEVEDGCSRSLLPWRRWCVKAAVGREKKMVAPPLLQIGGGRRGWRRRLPWRVEGEEKIRVRVLGDEDDDVAESDWLIW